ncbi:hypothetical protein [Paractinoplanes durhamensis]|uniref:Uncharacterized protein n=1 Tax=Paractinoplanes durhamensis TaxID=113563 RepID=A0ABQ3YYW0_9ACTN|nr:hypothetical protein [Actinoplanes durhamensis]GIE02778.1 hypothetical protein Adu01nite_41280 [Actinoplanes durhamensis]
MNEERELRSRLEELDVPPSRVEMDEVLRAGRKRSARRTTTRAATGAAVAIGLLLGAPPVLSAAWNDVKVDVGPSTSVSPSVDPDLPVDPTPTRSARTGPIACQMRTLPVPKGLSGVEITAVDPAGKYIVGNATTKQNFKPILWTGGKAQALSIPGKSVQLSDVNAAGQVVGMITIGNEDYPFRWQNGSYQMLKLPAGDWHAYPVPRINAGGEVVLNVEPKGNTGGKDSFAIVWTAGSTKATKVPLPKGANALDINDDGTLVGAIYEGEQGATGAWAWDQQGRGRELKPDAGETAAGYHTQGDWAAGGLWPSMEPGLWNLRTGKLTHLKTPPDADLAPAMDGVGAADAVNALGWVVSGGYVLLEDGPLKLPVPAGRTAWASAVADTGLVAGTLKNDVYNLGVAVWQC